jgi:hypothetical protein
MLQSSFLEERKVDWASKSRPQRLKPHLLFEPKSARVELVPFPVDFSEDGFSIWETERPKES